MYLSSLKELDLLTRAILKILERWYSVVSRCAYAEEAAERRSKLFSQEKQRQIDLIKRVEKIKVNYCGIPEDGTLYMNKDLSTPFNVAQRKSELIDKHWRDF